VSRLRLGRIFDLSSWWSTIYLHSANTQFVPRQLANLKSERNEFAAELCADLLDGIARLSILSVGVAGQP
jgi:hypothetical protein